MPTITKKKPKPLGARARKKSDAQMLAKAAASITKVILAKIAASKPKFMFKADELAAITTRVSSARTAALKYERDLKAGAAKFRAGGNMPTELVDGLAKLHKQIAVCRDELGPALETLSQQYNLVRGGQFEQVVDMGVDDAVLSNVMQGLQSLKRDHGDRFTVTMEPGRTVVRVLMERFQVVQDRCRASYGPFVLTFDPSRHVADGYDYCILAVPTKDCPLYGKTHRYHPHVTAHDGTVCMGEAAPFIKDAYRAGRIWDIYGAVDRLLRDPNYALWKFEEKWEFKCGSCGKWSAAPGVQIGADRHCGGCYFTCPISGMKHPKKNGVVMGGITYGPESVVRNKRGENPVLATACLFNSLGLRIHPDDAVRCFMSDEPGCLPEVTAAGKMVVEEGSVVPLPDGRHFRVAYLDLICKVATKEQNDGTAQDWQTLAYWQERITTGDTNTDAAWFGAFRAKLAERAARQAARPAQTDQD